MSARDALVLAAALVLVVAGAVVAAALASLAANLHLIGGRPVSIHELDWPDKPADAALCTDCETRLADMTDNLCPECRDDRRAEDDWWVARQERLREWADEAHRRRLRTRGEHRG